MSLKRLFSAFILSAFCVLLRNFSAGITGFTSKEFSSSFPLWLFLAALVIFYVVITLIGKITRPKNTDDVFLIISTALYSISLASETDNDIMNLLSVIFAVAIAVLAVLQNEKLFIYRVKFPKTVMVTLTVLLGVFMAGFIGTVTVFRYLTFSAPNFDFGLFCNMFHHMATDFTQTVSSERDRLLSHFAVHFSPVYYLILPFYFVFQSPITLQLAQAVIVASGIIPVALICRQKNIGAKSTVAFAAIYALYPALSGGCFYDLHENCFLAPFVLWLLWSTGADGKKGIFLKLLFACLTLTVKEDAFIYVVFAGLYFLFSELFPNGEKSGRMSVKEFFAPSSLEKNEIRALNIRRAVNLSVIVTAILYFAFTSWYLTRYGLGIMTNRFENFIVDGGTLADAVKNVIRNPILAFTEIFDNADKIKFAFAMLLPLAFLPFVTKKPSRYILIAPFVLVNLMPDYKYQHSIYFQYVFASSAFLIYASVVNAAELSAKAKRGLIALSVAFSVLIYETAILSKSYYVGNYFLDRERYIELEAALDRIPSDATVSATTFYLPHIADRDEIYQCSSEADEAITRTDYVVLDMRGVGDEECSILIRMYELKGYKNTEYIDELLLVFASGDYLESHPEIETLN